MKEKNYDNIFKYLKVAGLAIAIIIVTCGTLMAFYEPIDIHVDVESVEREVKDSQPENEIFPSIENGGWV